MVQPNVKDCRAFVVRSRVRCWIFGCHAPYRGGDINLFLAQSADLSAVATARIARAFPFDAKDFLGSAGFPTSTST